VPTFAWTSRFRADFDALRPEQQEAFLDAVALFVEDLRTGGRLRRGLRVKGVKGASGVFEMAWADDGRATFQYGDAVIEGEAHVVWRRVGTHAIFKQP
jgi:hypothetical protein